MRVIAGELDGHAGPGVTHTPITLVHAFVMNTKEELAQAFEDYQKGLLGSIPAQPASGLPADHPGHDVL